MQPTDVWGIMNRETGEPLHTVRLFRDVPTDIIESIADYAGPGLTKAVLWNERTGQVIW